MGSKASSSGKRTKLGRSLVAGVKPMVPERGDRTARALRTRDSECERQDDSRGAGIQPAGVRAALRSQLAFPPGMGTGAPPAGVGGACLHAGHSKPTSGGAESAQGCSSLRRRPFLRRIDCAVAQIRSRREGETAREEGTQATLPGGRTRQTRAGQTRPMRQIRCIRPDSESRSSWISRLPGLSAASPDQWYEA